MSRPEILLLSHCTVAFCFFDSKMNGYYYMNTCSALVVWHNHRLLQQATQKGVDLLCSDKNGNMPKVIAPHRVYYFFENKVALAL